MQDGERTARNRHGVYCLPDGVDHRPAVRTVLNGQVYEPDTIDFMCRQVGGGDIVHAGAFFGDFLPALSAALAPGGRLWAFEPNPASYRAARRTVEINRLDNVELTHAALSSRPGRLLMRVRDDNGRPLGGVSEVVPEPGPGVEPVPAVAVDDVVPKDRRVAILQLDVEGHEIPALRGARRIVTECRPVLILERFRRIGWLRRAFPDCGYERSGKLHGNSVYSARA